VSPRMSRMTLKSSTIFISVGSKTRVYRSVDDVPPPLRKRLEQSTNGIHSATILIADRRGREEIVRAIRGLPTGLRSRLAQSLTGEVARAKPLSQVWELARNCAEVVITAALGLAVWALFSWK
jgi:hypothetical protein